MGFIQKYFPVIATVLLIVLYLFTRLYNILGLPIFTDEAIYIRWSQIALNDSDWRFISLTDGKQPLFIWLAAFFAQFIMEPLLAGRFVSIFAGFLTAIGIFLLTYEIFKKRKTAFLACFLYIIFPFSLVYDRMALYDSLIAMFIIWSLYLQVKLIKNVKLVTAIALGIIMGCGMLTKTIAEFAMILLPFSLVLFNFNQKYKKQKLTRWIIYSLLSVFIAFAIYNLLRLSPFFYIIEQKNHLFIFTFNEWIQNPLAVFLKNISVFVEWTVDYTTIPFLILAISAIFLKTKFRKEVALLYFWFLVPLISTALFGRLVYPRFLLFMVLPLITVASFSLNYLLGLVRPVFLKYAIFIVFILILIIKDFYILTDFKNAPIPRADKGQFISGWPSGVGVNETIKYLEAQSKNQKIFIGTQGTFGLMPYALEIYLHKNPNIQIAGYWPVNESPPGEIMAMSKKMPVYFVFYQECASCKNIGIAPGTWPVEKIFQIEKNEKGNYYTLYKINPQ